VVEVVVLCHVVAVALRGGGEVRVAVQRAAAGGGTLLVGQRDDLIRERSGRYRTR
jgi:hypothetical protein